MFVGIMIPDCKHLYYLLNGELGKCTVDSIVLCALRDAYVRDPPTHALRKAVLGHRAPRLVRRKGSAKRYRGLKRLRKRASVGVHRFDSCGGTAMMYRMCGRDPVQTLTYGRRECRTGILRTSVGREMFPLCCSSGTQRHLS